MKRRICQSLSLYSTISLTSSSFLKCAVIFYSPIASFSSVSCLRTKLNPILACGFLTAYSVVSCVVFVESFELKLDS